MFGIVPAERESPGQCRTYHWLLTWDAGKHEFLARVPLAPHIEWWEVMGADDGRIAVVTAGAGANVLDPLGRGSVCKELIDMRTAGSSIRAGSPTAPLLAAIMGDRQACIRRARDLYASEELHGFDREAVNHGAWMAWHPTDAEVEATWSRRPSTEWLADACRIANRELTQEEWREYVGDEQWQAICATTGP